MDPVESSMTTTFDGLSDAILEGNEDGTDDDDGTSDAGAFDGTVPLSMEKLSSIMKWSRANQSDKTLQHRKLAD